MINNVVVPSAVAPGYAPEGRHLVGVSIVPNEDGPVTLDDQVRGELTEWFGPGVVDWSPLRTYRIPHALPLQAAGQRTLSTDVISITERGVIVCGDHKTTSSINGAMASGRGAAEAILASASRGG